MPSKRPFFSNSSLDLSHLRADPSPEALAWVGDQFGGAPVLAVEFLAGGISHSNHAITLGGSTQRQVVLRRWTRAGWQDDEPDYDVAHDAATLTLLEETGFPAPRLIATDPEGDQCGFPALLMTRLEGGLPDDGTGRSPRFFQQLAATALDLHRIPAPWPGIRAYANYHDHNDTRFPSITTRPAVWERALEVVVAREVPDTTTHLIHRDYHAGNTLWAGDRLTGVVDWASASRGPVGVDLGHMRWNLVTSMGEWAADAYLKHYTDLAGGFEYDSYWDLETVVDLLPDDGFGPADLERIEPYLEAALARC